MPWLHSSYRNLSFSPLQLQEDLLKLRIRQRNRKLACLRELNYLQFELLREIGLNHLKVRQALPGFRRQQLPEQFLFLLLELLFLRLLLTLRPFLLKLLKFLSSKGR